MENLRDETHENTWVNSATAGAAAGVVMGSMARRFDVMASTALGLGALMGMVEYNGQKQLQAKTSKTVISDKAEASSPVEELKKRYPEFKHL